MLKEGPVAQYGQCAELSQTDKARKPPNSKERKPKTRGSSPRGPAKFQNAFRMER